MENSTIVHDGIIVEVMADVVRVQILSQTACSSCHAKGACTASDSELKIIDVSNPHSDYHVGDKVQVSMFSNQGLRALFYAYVIPFIILISTLIISSAFVHELIAGLISLFVLVPYYAILYFTKDRIANKFSYMLNRLS